MPKETAFILVMVCFLIAAIVFDRLCKRITNRNYNKRIEEETKFISFDTIHFDYEKPDAFGQMMIIQELLRQHCLTNASKTE